VFEPSKFKSDVEVDSPTTKIYRFYGAIVHPGGERVLVGTENLLLRDCVLKNTDFVEGIVVYAGKSLGMSSSVVMYCICLIIYAQFM
jgi:phospholipid-translocating ATPase